MKTDYLIIGQGIAGTLFSYELAKQGQDFIIIDPDKHNASKTAAGMYNPVVLKRFSPVWQGKKQILTAKKTITELEKKLNKTLDYRFPIYRIFHNNEEKQTWSKKANDDTLCELLDTHFTDSPNEQINAPYGLGKVNFGGRVNLGQLLASYRQQLSVQGKIYTELFDYQALKMTDIGVEYKEIITKKIIFCEGYGIKQNPFFNHLPLNGNKGEVMIVRVPNLQLTSAIKSKVFIMPLPENGDDVYFVGATYNWTDKDDIPTDKGRCELLEKLQHFIDGEIEILGHRAGIRPTVADRRPLLGQHSDYPQLYILNGLGTRGVMLGATMAKQLYDFIEKGIELDLAVNIQRFMEQ